MRQAAGMGAGICHMLWQQVVHGTRSAHAWHAFHARHLAEPAKYPLARVEADFWNQPRVTAIRIHNAANYGAVHLAVSELEMFEAGPTAYQHYSAMSAVCGDVLLTPDGHKLAPVSVRSASVGRVTKCGLWRMRWLARWQMQVRRHLVMTRSFGQRTGRAALVLIKQAGPGCAGV